MSTRGFTLSLNRDNDPIVVFECFLKEMSVNDGKLPKGFIN